MLVDTKELIERRKRLSDKLENNSLTLIYSGVSKLASGDDTLYPFVPNRNFFYLTNISQEDSCLMIVKTDEGIFNYLFILEADLVKEKWYGKRITIEKAKLDSGIDNVLYIQSLNPKIDQVINADHTEYGLIQTLYLDGTPEIKIDNSKSVNDLKVELQHKYKGLHILDVNPLITRLRMVKSPAEVDLIRESIRVTSVGIKALLNSLEPGLFEYQFASLFEYIIKDYANARLSFDTICASGSNGTILHYPNPLSRVRDGDLILFDLGAELNGYHADISRTFPVSGKFNPLQRTIYQIVLDCNNAVIDYIKPGLLISDLQEFAKNFLADGLLKEGIIKNKDEIFKYYYHNVSHHLGLDTHDVSDRQIPLEAGNVITVEPGLYLKEFGIGIRIEDDVLVTKTGAISLSKEIIKSVNDIEIECNKQEE